MNFETLKKTQILTQVSLCKQGRCADAIHKVGNFLSICPANE